MRNATHSHTHQNNAGYGPDGGKNIREHAFFASINWEALYKKEIKAPFVPKVTSDSDISNIDEEFTSEGLHSVTDDSALDEKPHFSDFTYVPKSKLGGGKKGADVGVLEEEDL